MDGWPGASPKLHRKSGIGAPGARNLAGTPVCREATFDYDHHNPLFVRLELYVFGSITSNVQITNCSSIPLTSTFNALAFCRLVRRAFAPHELSFLVDTIFSSEDECDRINFLHQDDAQDLADVLDEARSAFAHVCRIDIDTFCQLGVG